MNQLSSNQPEPNWAPPGGTPEIHEAFRELLASLETQAL